MSKSKVTFDTSGLDKIIANAEDLPKQQSVSLADLLSPTFISQHTKFSNLDELFESGGFKFESLEEFESIPDEDLDNHIKSNSSFPTFQDMYQTAAGEYIKSQLLSGL